MRKQLLASLLSLFLPMATVNGAATSDLQTANKAFLDADRDFCHKYFEVEAPSEAGYYMALWLMPAKYADGSFTKYSIYVNSAYIGDVNPTRGNWQSAAISGNPKIKLQKGKNVISVACAYPEYPMVEKIVLSPTLANATISSENYDNYLSKATANELLDNEYDEEVDDFTSSTAKSNNSGVVANDLPLRYTFYTINHFAAQQDVYISSNSSIRHHIDVLYYQTNQPSIALVDSLIIDPIDPLPPNSIIPGLIHHTAKPMPLFLYSSTVERQGLNWKGESEQALNSNMHITSMRFTAEKEGKYLIRLRTHNNTLLGTADVNINGSYFYDNVPISCSYSARSMPADGETYAAYTVCENPNTDDPMLFIHGADADRIVAFNDDASSNNRLDDMCTYDSFIAQSYIIESTRISVNNYSSSNPESTCTVYVRVPFEDIMTLKQKKHYGEDYQAGIEHDLSTTDVSIPSQISIASTFSVQANLNIKRVAVFNLMGALIGSVTLGSTDCAIHPSSLNIHKRGIYVMQVETENGIISKKIMVI